jgi:hypothetical protein
MANAVTYAEQTLDVNNVYERAVLLIEQAKSNGAELVRTRSEVRDLESQIMMREMRVTEEEWVKHPEMAVTRMDKHIKTAFLQDAALDELYTKLRGLKAQVDILDMQRSGLDASIRVESARMVELGGYFQYLAAAKMAAGVSEQR